ncbi:hypothetical protein L7F22_058789, partial [Adiantum nelumboides]|nr:hypothetical protein [Adiantum nelumboides]
LFEASKEIEQLPPTLSDGNMHDGEGDWGFDDPNVSTLKDLQAANHQYRELQNYVIELEGELKHIKETKNECLAEFKVTLKEFKNWTDAVDVDVMLRMIELQHKFGKGVVPTTVKVEELEQHLQEQSDAIWADLKKTLQDWIRRPIQHVKQLFV